MTKNEVMAFGVPEEKYREFQAAYHRDVNKAAGRLAKNVQPAQVYRTATMSLLEAIKEPGNHKKILNFVYQIYFSEV